MSRTAPSHAVDTTPMTDEPIKRSAARKDRVASRATPSSDSMDDLSVADQKLKKGAARRNRIASRSPLSEEAKQEKVEQDQDVENVTPGAVQVSGMDSMDSTGGDQEDGLTRAGNGVHSEGSGDEGDGLTITSEHNLTLVGANVLQHETSAVPSSTGSIMEAQLVEENEREQLEEELRENLEEELRVQRSTKNKWHKWRKQKLWRMMVPKRDAGPCAVLLASLSSWQPFWEVYLG